MRNKLLRTVGLMSLIWLRVLTDMAASQGFVESFDGEGWYPTTNATYEGLDSPGWSIEGEGSFRDGGFYVRNNPMRDGGEGVTLVHGASGLDSFVETVELTGVDLGTVDWIGGPNSEHSTIYLEHKLSAEERSNRLVIWAFENDDDVSSWRMGIHVGVGRNPTFRDVPPGRDISLQIAFDASLSTALFTYDPDRNDDDPGLTFGPFDYTGIYTPDQVSWLSVSAGGFAANEATIDFWSLHRDHPLIGDFDANGELGVPDANRLMKEIRVGNSHRWFDLTTDSSVDLDDLNVWVHEVKQTYFGDANLDGEFDSTDMVRVFLAGEYEDSLVENSTWGTGDWNADGEFTSKDIVAAFLDGGYEQGPRPPAVVPEPSALWLLLGGGLLLVRRARRSYETLC